MVNITSGRIICAGNVIELVYEITIPFRKYGNVKKNKINARDY